MNKGVCWDNTRLFTLLGVNHGSFNSGGLGGKLPWVLESNSLNSFCFLLKHSSNENPSPCFSTKQLDSSVGFSYVGMPTFNYLHTDSTRQLSV